ncbi:hypothetical protein FQA39_LY12892 [Lamprigera yunnana]|nr:hypothetical protein FQA39_LY12892 [Lamprigera yunnana]
MRVEQLRQRVEIENQEKLQEELIAEKEELIVLKKNKDNKNVLINSLMKADKKIMKQWKIEPIIEETNPEDFTLFEMDEDENPTLSIENDVMTMMDEKEEYQDINLEEIIEKFNLDDEGLTIYDHKEAEPTILMDEETINVNAEIDEELDINVDDYLSEDNNEFEVEEIIGEMPTPVSFDSTNETITNDYQNEETINLIDTMPEINEEQLTIMDFNEEDNTIVISNNEQQQEYDIDELEAIDMLNHNLSNPFDENGDDNLNGEVELELVLDFNPKLGQIIAFNDSEYEICGMSVKTDQIGEEVPIMLLKDLNTFEMIEVRFIKEI